MLIFCPPSLPPTLSSLPYRKAASEVRYNTKFEAQIRARQDGYKRQWFNTHMFNKCNPLFSLVRPEYFQKKFRTALHKTKTESLQGGQIVPSIVPASGSWMQMDLWAHIHSKNPSGVGMSGNGAHGRPSSPTSAVTDLCTDLAGVPKGRKHKEKIIRKAQFIGAAGKKATLYAKACRKNHEVHLNRLSAYCEGKRSIFRVVEERNKVRAAVDGNRVINQSVGDLLCKVGTATGATGSRALRAGLKKGGVAAQAKGRNIRLSSALHAEEGNEGGGGGKKGGRKANDSGESSGEGSEWEGGGEDEDREEEEEEEEDREEMEEGREDVEEEDEQTKGRGSSAKRKKAGSNGIDDEEGSDGEFGLEDEHRRPCLPGGRSKPKNNTLDAIRQSAMQSAKARKARRQEPTSGSAASIAIAKTLKQGLQNPASAGAGAFLAALAATKEAEAKRAEMEEQRKNAEMCLKVYDYMEKHKCTKADLPKHMQPFV